MEEVICQVRKRHQPTLLSTSMLCVLGVEQIGDVGLDGISNTIATYNSTKKITT
jgi:hypothetical protein